MEAVVVDFLPKRKKKILFEISGTVELASSKDAAQEPQKCGGCLFLFSQGVPEN